MTLVIHVSGYKVFHPFIDKSPSNMGSSSGILVHASFNFGRPGWRNSETHATKTRGTTTPLHTLTRTPGPILRIGGGRLHDWLGWGIFDRNHLVDTQYSQYSRALHPHAMQAHMKNPDGRKLHEAIARKQAGWLAR